jgi:type II secretory pathway pseudopilin PulG
MNQHNAHQVTTTAGYTLIELVIVMLFSGIIISTLFSSFALLTRVSRAVDSLISFDARRALLANQIQKDIAGAFIPIQALIEEKKELPSTAVDEKKVVEISKEPQEKKPKRLQDPFISKEKNNRLSLLSFISRNPLRVYQKEKGVIEKPRVVRIIYRLVEQKEKPGYFTLFRQEGTQLDLDVYNKKADSASRMIEVADNIKDIKVTLAAEKKQEKKESKKEFVTSSVWPLKDEARAKEVELLPVQLELAVSLWDDREQASSFKLIYPIGAA